MSSESISRYAPRKTRHLAERAAFGSAWVAQSDRRGAGERSISAAHHGAHSIEKARNIDVFRPALEISNFVIKKRGESTSPEENIYTRDDRVGYVFGELKDAWLLETGLLSSLTDIVLNENYQKIIGLGPKAVPWILDDLGETMAPWFWALRMITRVDPVDHKDRGDVERMVKSWLNWARENKIE
ncbi:hypothetical protein [Burkholderia glumae]